MQTSVEENLRVVEASTEAFNAHDLDRFFRLRVESLITHDPSSPEPLKGREAARKNLAAYLTAFPDVHVRKERTFGQGDWTCLEATATGTHKGPLAGPGGQIIPATNKPVRVPLVVVAKHEGGQITEEHNYFDLFGMMAQLGLTQ